MRSLRCNLVNSWRAYQFRGIDCIAVVTASKLLVLWVIMVPEGSEDVKGMSGVLPHGLLTGTQNLLLAVLWLVLRRSRSW